MGLVAVAIILVAPATGPEPHSDLPRAARLDGELRAR
jgi:hypothetical protein